MDREGGSEGGVGLRLGSGLDRQGGRVEESGRVTVILASYQVPSSADDVMDDCRPGIRVVGLRLGPIWVPMFLTGTYEKTLMTC